MSKLECFCSKSAACRNSQPKNLKFPRNTFICKFCHTRESGIVIALPQPSFFVYENAHQDFLIAPPFPACQSIFAQKGEMNLFKTQAP